MSRSREKARQRTGASEGDYSRELLERLARILQQTGHSPKALAKVFVEICRHLNEPTQRWDPSSRLLVADLAHVTAHWYADAEYHGGDGAPRALPRRGRCSLTSLIEKVLPGRAPDAIIDSLAEVHAIAPEGKLYRPTGKALTYSRHRLSARLHGLSALLAILRTVEYNTSQPQGMRLFERAAINPRFPVRKLPEMLRRLGSRGDNFLWQSDGDMRQVELPAESSETTRLWVGVYISEDPLVTGTGSHEEDRPSRSHVKGKRRAAPLRGRRGT
jgi:hypothetical protein